MFCSSDLTQREEVEVWPWIAATNNCVLKGALSNEGNSELELLFLRTHNSGAFVPDCSVMFFLTELRRTHELKVFLLSAERERKLRQITLGSFVFPTSRKGNVA